MKRFASCILITFLLGVCSFAQTRSRTWQRISETKDGEIVYVHKNRFRTSSMYIKRFWVKYADVFADIDNLDYSSVEALGTNNSNKDQESRTVKIKPDEDYSHTLELTECDCKNTTIRTLQRLKYSHAGTVMESNKNFDKAENVIPDTIGETVFNHVCRHKKNKF